MYFNLLGDALCGVAMLCEVEDGAPAARFPEMQPSFGR
jgi:hypothetical protein